MAPEYFPSHLEEMVHRLSQGHTQKYIDIYAWIKIATGSNTWLCFCLLFRHTKNTHTQTNPMKWHSKKMLFLMEISNEQSIKIHLIHMIDSVLKFPFAWIFCVVENFLPQIVCNYIFHFVELVNWRIFRYGVFFHYIHFNAP